MKNKSKSKSKSKSKIARIFSGIFKIRTWFDWDRMKACTLALKNGAKTFFVPQKSTASESFHAAKTRMNLSDKELLAQQNALLRLSILMVVTGLCVFSYSIYQIIYGSFKGFIVSLIVTMIAMVLAFRYHFWYFQIKNRKLGCTLDQWFRQGLLGKKND